MLPREILTLSLYTLAIRLNIINQVCAFNYYVVETEITPCLLFSFTVYVVRYLHTFYESIHVSYFNLTLNPSLSRQQR